MIMIMIIMTIPWSAMTSMVSLLSIIMTMVSMGSLLAAILIVVVIVVMYHSWLFGFGVSSWLWVPIWWHQIRIWLLRVLVPWGHWHYAKFRLLHALPWGPHHLG